jgi:type VI secretion system protein ImpF
MADLTPQDRLFPSLLDRLTDDQPDRKQDARDSRAFAIGKLRECVLRDLGSLLNTCHGAATEDFGPYPNVAKSVLNYGIPDLTGKTVSGLDLHEIERELRQAILNFEPRILARSLQVRGQISSNRWTRNALSFEIQGEIWSYPVPERLSLRTELNVETGAVTLREA